MMGFFIFIAWLVLCGAAAAYAGNKGRSAVGIFFLSLFLSPLVGFLVAVAMEPHARKVAEARGFLRLNPERFRTWESLPAVQCRAGFLLKGSRKAVGRMEKSFLMWSLMIRRILPF